MNKFPFVLATAGVALVIVFDIVTGQGPPQLQSFLAGTPLQYNIPPRVSLLEQPSPFSQRGPYGELQQQQAGYSNGPSELKQGGEPKFEAITEEEYEKNLEGKRGYENVGYENKGDDKSSYNLAEPVQKPTSSGGMFSGLTNAWKTLTSLGRRTKRGAIDSLPGGSFSKGNSDPGAEWSQSNNQGYIYFKIPKNSICYN